MFSNSYQSQITNINPRILQSYSPLKEDHNRQITTSLYIYSLQLLYTQERETQKHESTLQRLLK